MGSRHHTEDSVHPPRGGEILVTIATGFSRHLDRFQKYWRSLWGLTPGARSTVLDRALALQAAKAVHDFDEQRRIVDDVDNEAGVTPPHGTLALSILDYVAHLWRESSESENEMISEFGRLGFFDADDRDAQTEWIRSFFTRLSEESKGSAS